MNKFTRVHPYEIGLLDVYILSAEFGLISACKPIPNYDRRMTLQRAKELQPHTLPEVKRIFSGKQYDELFISMGKAYRQALVGYESLIPTNLKVIVSKGPMGRKLAELRNWLRVGVSESPDTQMKIVQQGRARLRDIEIVLTSQQIMDVARSALEKEQSIPTYQVWYVQVDDQKVPPKWLVRQLTGLPVSAFHTNEARRVLQQLGIEIYSR